MGLGPEASLERGLSEEACSRHELSNFLFRRIPVLSARRVEPLASALHGKGCIEGPVQINIFSPPLFSKIRHKYGPHQRANRPSGQGRRAGFWGTMRVLFFYL